MKKIIAIVGLIGGLLAIGAVLVAYGADKEEVKKDIEILDYKYEEVAKEVTEHDSMIMEQRVYNERVTTNLENVTRILERMSDGI